MQVIIKNIQRPTLFQEFFNKLITYSNEVIEYVNTSTINNVTSMFHKNVNTLTNTIKKSINLIIEKSISFIKILKTRFHGMTCQV